MALATEFHIPHLGFSGRMSAVSARFAEARARRKTYRKVVDELNALSTRDLADLGIAPCQIHAIAHEAAHGAN